MDLIEQMSHRRSVRTYESRAIDQELLGRVLAAGMLAPTGRGKRPWELICITDRTTLDSLADCRTLGSQMLRGAAAAIVVVGDAELSDTWIEDCSLVMGQMHLMADALGLGSCWIQGRGRTAGDGRTTQEYVTELLHIPEPFQLEAILSLGWPKDAPAPHELSELPFSKVHLDRF